MATATAQNDKSYASTGCQCYTCITEWHKPQPKEENGSSSTVIAQTEQLSSRILSDHDENIISVTETLPLLPPKQDSSEGISTGGREMST